jgi:hypothetical protein
VEPEGLETPSPDDSLAMAASAGQTSAGQTSETAHSGNEDALVDLFRHKFQVPVESFLQQMREQRQSVETHSD